MHSENKPLLSVIVPVYNVEKYLPACVESIQAQTMKNLEIILVDDGSPDGCPGLCEELARTDTRIRVLHKENGGLASARNAGLEQARGNYISFIDSDDRIPADLFEKALVPFESEEIDLVGFGIEEVWSQKSVPLTFTEGKMAPETAIQHLLRGDGQVRSFAWNKLYRKEALKGLRFDEKLRYGEDTPFVFEALARSRGYYQLNEPRYLYMRREDSLIGTEYAPTKSLVLMAAQSVLEACQSEPKKKKYLPYAQAQLAFACFSLARMLFLTPDWKKRYPQALPEIEAKLKEVPLKIIINQFSKGLAAKTLLVRWLPGVYAALCGREVQHEK